MSLAKHAIRGAGWSMIGGYISQFVAFAMFIVTSRLVGPAAFGAVAISLGIVELCRSFTTESIAANLVANPNAAKDDFNAGFVWTLTSTAIVCLILTLVSAGLAALLRTPALTSVLPQISLLLLGYGASRLQEARMVKTMRFRMLAVRTILAALIGGGVGVWCAMHSMGAQALVYQQWASAAVSTILLWSASDWRPRLRFSAAQFVALQRTTWALAPANIVYGLGVIVDGLAIAMFAGPAAAGIYNLGKRVVVAMMMAFSAALDRVSLATFAQVQHDKPRLARALDQGLSVTMLVVLPVFIGIGAISQELIAIAMGAEWSAAATPLTILLVGAAVAIATCYFENIQLVLERRRWIAAQRVVFVCLLLAGISLFGRFGPVAIACVTLGATLVQNGLAALAVSRLISFSIALYVRHVGACFVLALAMLALVAGLRTAPSISDLTPLERVIPLVAAGALFYAGTAWLLVRRSLQIFLQTARSAI